MNRIKREEYFWSSFFFPPFCSLSLKPEYSLTQLLIITFHTSFFFFFQSWYKLWGLNIFFWKFNLNVYSISEIPWAMMFNQVSHKNWEAWKKKNEKNTFTFKCLAYLIHIRWLYLFLSLWIKKGIWNSSGLMLVAICFP